MQWLNLIELRRRQFSLSLEALAERAGISAQTLTNLRKGGNPHPRTLAALQSALDLPPTIDEARLVIHKAVEGAVLGTDAHTVAVEALAVLADLRIRQNPERQLDILRNIVELAAGGGLDDMLKWLRDMDG